MSEPPEILPPQASYEGWTRRPLFFLPVTLRGELMGYIWASVQLNSAGFVRNMKIREEKQFADPFDDPTLWCGDVWSDRLAAAYEEGIPARDAVRRWIGAPEDPRGGRIPEQAQERQAPSLAALYEWIDPEGPPPPNPLIQDGEFPDGTPEDRSKGWGPLVSILPPRYPVETDAAVRAFPVTQGGVVLGYLWASMTREAAGYLPCTATAQAGVHAAGLWHIRLSQAYEAGYSALQALDWCREQPEDRLSGVIGLKAPMYEFSNLGELQNLANQ